MIKIIGLCIVLFTIYYACSRVINTRRQREALVLKLFELVGFLRDGIALYMRPLPQLYSSFRWGVLAEYGFPDVLLRGGWRSGGLWAAVGDEVAEILIPLLDGLGTHGYAEELACLDRARERLSSVLDGVRGRAERTRRLAVTLALSLSLAITILVI